MNTREEFAIRILEALLADPKCNKRTGHDLLVPFSVGLANDLIKALKETK